MSEVEYIISGCPYKQYNGAYIKYMLSFRHIDGTCHLSYNIMCNAWSVNDGCRTAHGLLFGIEGDGPAESGWQCLHPNALDNPNVNNSGWLLPAPNMRVKKYVPRPAPKPRTAQIQTLIEPKSWLAVRLLSIGLPIELVIDCEEKLVNKEGFVLERDFAEMDTNEFTPVYLNSIGITAKGVQKRLLSLHAFLVTAR